MLLQHQDAAVCIQRVFRRYLIRMKNRKSNAAFIPSPIPRLIPSPISGLNDTPNLADFCIPDTLMNDTPTLNNIPDPCEFPVHIPRLSTQPDSYVPLSSPNKTHLPDTSYPHVELLSCFSNILVDTSTSPSRTNVLKDLSPIPTRLDNIQSPISPTCMSSVIESSDSRHDDSFSSQSEASFGRHGLDPVSYTHLTLPTKA